MTKAASAIAPSAGNATRFEVRDGMRRIRCEVLDDALEAVSGLAVPSSAASRRTSFDRFRTLIDAAAKLKYRSNPTAGDAPMVLTREDLERVPPTIGEPPFGSHARGVARVTVAAAVPSPDGPND